MKKEDLMAKAKSASQNSYSPYSKFAVGACVLCESGNVYVGTNVENASYGLTICAERNAIANAVVNGEKHICAVAIYSPNAENCFPCGACRQVIFEFASKDGVDIVLEQNGEIMVHKINDLLPEGFTL